MKSYKSKILAVIGLLLTLCILGGIGYWTFSVIGSNKKSQASFPTEPVITSEVLSYRSGEKAEKFIPFSAALLAMDNKFPAMKDASIGMGTEIREEVFIGAGVAKPFEVKWEGGSLKMPKQPSQVISRVLYSQVNGIVPLNVSATWVGVKDPEKCISAEFKPVEVKGKGKLYRAGDATYEITEKSVTFSFISPSDQDVRQYGDNLNRYILDGLTEPVTVCGITWRDTSPLSRYRIGNKNQTNDVEMLTLTDSTFKGQKILMSGMDLWKEIPLSYSCLIEKDNWKKIEADIQDEIKDYRWLTLKTEDVGEKGIKFSITDQELDKKLLELYMRASQTNVSGLRSKFVKIEEPKPEPKAETKAAPTTEVKTEPEAEKDNTDLVVPGESKKKIDLSF